MYCKALKNKIGISNSPAYLYTMRRTELRLGNIIAGIFDEYTTIVSIDESNITGTNRKNNKSEIYSVHGHLWQPVKLTHEWLERLGFERKADDYFELQGILVMKPSGGDDYYSIAYRKDGALHTPINHSLNYVHQLQNRVYELANIEISI